MRGQLIKGTLKIVIERGALGIGKSEMQQKSTITLNRGGTAISKIIFNHFRPRNRAVIDGRPIRKNQL